MGHGIHGHGNCQDQDIVLSFRNLHAVGVGEPEPLLGDFGYLVHAPA